MTSNDKKLMRLALSLHTRTVVGLIDAAMRADTTAQRNERLALARDAVIEFRNDILPTFMEDTCASVS